MDVIDYTPFSSLRPHFDVLARVGYIKIVLRTPSPTKLGLHNAYRLFIWIVVLTYNLQHIVKVVMANNTDEVVDTLYIMLTTINTLAKQITFNLRSSRIDDIIELINESEMSKFIVRQTILTVSGWHELCPKFALSMPYHVHVMRSNGLAMSYLWKFYHACVVGCAGFVTIFPIVNRLQGEDYSFTGYILGFGIALAYMSILLIVQAYGNMTMDCTIVAYFSQARAQMQILRYDMEQLTNLNDVASSKISRRNQVYEDYGDGIMQQRLVRCVEHHKSILWFVKEIQSIFSEAMALQFIILTLVICMTVYKIARLNNLSAEFVSLALYLVCMLSQLFIYCYFGSQLTVESEFLCQFLYSTDWLCLSPRFRRRLLMIMHYCSNPVTLTTAYIIPMSLDTYIKILRLSYSLFTVLNR